jgi:hypothetical protein
MGNPAARLLLLGETALAPGPFNFSTTFSPMFKTVQTPEFHVFLAGFLRGIISCFLLIIRYLCRPFFTILIRERYVAAWL